MTREGKKFTLDGRTVGCDTAMGRVLRTLLETAVGGGRWPAGEKGLLPGEFTPPGFVPVWTLCDAVIGGSEGDRRCREIVHYAGRKTGVEVEEAFFKPADPDVVSKVSMRRIDLCTVPENVFYAFNISRPFEAGRRPEFTPPQQPGETRATPSTGSVGSADEKPATPGLAPIDARLDPLAGQIFFAPHHLEQQIKDSGVPAERVIACYPHLDAKEGYRGWDLRWKYPVGAMLMSNDGRHSPEQLYEWVRRCFKNRISLDSPIREKFLSEIDAACRLGAILVYGDHEKPTHRGAYAVARILQGYAKKHGIDVTVAGEWQPEKVEATA